MPRGLLPISASAFLCLLAAQLPALDASAAPFLITEFMAHNTKTLNDENGDQSDWIEIHNPGPAAGSLDGWFLTDDASQLAKWRFPDVILEANSYLIVFASGKNRTNEAGVLHTNFRLDHDGEYLALVDPATNIVSAFSPAYPPQLPDVSYGRDRLDPALVGYFTQPTPGAPNTPGGVGFATEVQFSRDSGTFPTNQPFELSLSTDLSNAMIYYAFGSNAPSSNGVASFLYTHPLQITNTTAVRARAFAPGLLPGPVTTKVYIGLTIQTNVLNFNSDLPILILHNYGQGILPADINARRYVFVEAFDAPCGRNSMTNRPDLVARGSFHTRGSDTLVSSSQHASFGLELRDEFDEDSKVPLLGLPAESDWVLYAPTIFEPALLQNPLSHALYRDQGFYSPRTRFVELFLKDDLGVPGAINSSNLTSAASAGDYQGIYVLEERVKRSKNRVNIPRLEPEHRQPPEVTGGYIFSIDRTAVGQPPLTTTAGTFNWMEPSAVTMTNANRAPQVNWIRGYINAFNASLTQNTYTNLDTTNHFSNYLDVDSWVSFHIHEVVTFNVDALRLDSFFFKDRGKKLQWGPPWDYDRSEGSTDGRDFAPRTFRSTASDLGTDFFNFAPFWNKLLAAPDFWQAWIDKYQFYRRPGQALSFDNIVTRINQFANEVREAQPREQARWNVPPRQGTITQAGFSYNFGTPSKYQNEIDFKYAWFSNRLDFIDTNFLAPPICNSPGGAVSNGFRFALLPAPEPGSSIIYSLDGTDPRAPGGSVSGHSFSNLGQVTLTVSSNVHVMARSYNPAHRNLTGPNNPPISSPWSGPFDASFYLSLPGLRITELMYHPPDPPAGSTNSVEDFEYIEFANIGAVPLNLSRFKLRGGVTFDFGDATLPAGQSGILVRNPDAIASRYGNGLRILGVYTHDDLANHGENLELIGPLGEPILNFNYSDRWYPSTAGAGFSLVIRDPTAPVDTWGLRESWRPSGALNGSPGQPDSEPAVPVPTVYLNEILVNPDSITSEAIELFNPADVPVEISGWYLTDDPESPRKFLIPNGTLIGPQGYSVFFAAFPPNLSLSFGGAFRLSPTGGSVYLYSADWVTGDLTGYAHRFDYGPQARGDAAGRYVTSSGEQFPTLSAPSLGAANPAPKVGPLVITEINYHPLDTPLAFRAVDNCQDEYIELQNISGSPIQLYDPLAPASTWKLGNAVNFSFPAGTIIAAGVTILVVSIDPANAEQADGFRVRNGVAPGVALYGPWQGRLDNSGATVELNKPAGSSQNGAPFVLVEQVSYADHAPWPAAADGYGPVLQRVSLSGYANDASNWIAGVKTPGGPFEESDAPLITQQPMSLAVGEGASASFVVGVSGPGPFTYQWLFNGNILPRKTNSTLLLTAVVPNQAGQYSCLVLNPAVAVLSSPATLQVLVLPRITQNPASVSLRGSTNHADYGFTTNSATFSVTAAGVGELTYQWRKNGTPLAGANSRILTLPGVGLSDDGFYDVALSDELTTLVSTAARLTVLLTPTFLVPPAANIFVASNRPFAASAIIRGNPPPFRFEWREISTPRAIFIVNNTT
ncbi:MAG TPA: lamin tail domain-containing protein, partial [Candidatus Saccharimonadales bacterium]|nr:lamin tail domain-containing protein [Candidatus Saccharimonadales bacterium]